MAEFNANIVVQPYNIDVTLNQPGITVNPDVTSLNIYAVGGTNGVPAGNVGDLQYYAANGFAAVPSNIANYSNGNLNLSVTGTKIPGGTNGYFLQTDGTGNLNWAAGGGGGNGSPGGSNTQIQFNDSGLFGGVAGFTFNKVSGNVNIPGNLIVTGNIVANLSANYANFSGEVITNAQPNITSVGNLTNLNVVSTINAANMYATNFYGIFNGPANTAGTVTTAAQPNISSVGTLTGLTVNGNTTLNGTTSLLTGIETVTITTSPTISYNFDVLTSPIRLTSNAASSNLALNIRGNSTVTFNSLLSNGQSMTVSYAMTTGTTPYQITALSIDGAGVTPKFAGSTITSANSINTYTYTIIKNSGTFTVLGSITRYV